MPQNSNFRLPRCHRFRPKLDLTVKAPNHCGDPPPRVYLEANGVPLGPKNGSKPLEINMAQNSNFDYSAVIDFSQNLSFTLMAPNHGGDPLGSILGPMGFHWGQNMGQNLKKITIPQNSNFRLPRGHLFRPKFGPYGYGAKSRCGPPRVPLGANGVPLEPKIGWKP